jgi:serine/threonine protein kinase
MEIRSSNRRLESQNESLQNQVQRKRHSEKEMEAMRKAMEEQKEDRKDELRNVMVDSSELEIIELLGHGGMGKVHLANFHSQQVAVKQLITINDDSVMRFRRECFLTKELSHPNIVILVGVCWDAMMLGCVLEYVDGGSLQDRLKKDWNEDFEDKITWEGELLKWATEAALGCQCVHTSEASACKRSEREERAASPALCERKNDAAQELLLLPSASVKTMLHKSCCSCPLRA